MEWKQQIILDDHSKTTTTVSLLLLGEIIGMETSNVAIFSIYAFLPASPVRRNYWNGNDSTFFNVRSNIIMLLLLGEIIGMETWEVRRPLALLRFASPVRRNYWNGNHIRAQ